MIALMRGYPELIDTDLTPYDLARELVQTQPQKTGTRSSPTPTPQNSTKGGLTVTSHFSADRKTHRIEDMNKPNEQCWLCNQELTPTREHIFPQSIGGKQTVRWFICEKCNNDTGAQWDASLIDSIFLLSRLTKGALSHAASVNATLTDNDGGTIEAKLRGFDDIRFSKILKDGNNLSATVGDEKEARQVLKQWKKKYPNIDIEKTIRNAQRSVLKSRQVKFPIVFTIPKVEKSIVKTAMAWAFYNGIKPKKCELAYDFLRNGYPDDHPPQSWFLVKLLDDGHGASVKDSLELLKEVHPDTTSNLDVMLYAQLMSSEENLVAWISYGMFIFMVPLSAQYTGGKINTDPLLEIFTTSTDP